MALALKRWEPNPRGAKGERILIYHGVVPSPLPGLNSRFIDIQRFAEEMKWLHRHYQVVSLRQLAAGDYDKSTLAVGISFDDGYANNLRHALPILEKHKLPATFFVTSIRGLGRDILWPDLLNLTAYDEVATLTFRGEKYTSRNRNDFQHASTGESLLQVAIKSSEPEFIPELEIALDHQARFRQKPAWKDYWEQLTEDEIRQLYQEDRFDIGSHGGRHYNLIALPLPAAEADIAFSKQWLDKTVGRPIEAFAYPGGMHNDALNAAAERTGFSRIYLGHVHSGNGKANHIQTRFGIHPHVNAKVQLHFINEGQY